MQVHSLTDTTTQLATIREWHEEGRVRYVGVTTSNTSQHGEMGWIMRGEALDFVQVNYSLADRGAAERLLPSAADRGIAVTANLPFGRGRLLRALAGWPLPDWTRDFDCESWSQFLLKYIISHPAVTCAVPGTTQERHVVDNFGAAVGRLPNASLRRRQEELFDAF